MSKICLGCGSVLQISNRDLPGFILEEKYNDGIYCERCFRLKHYHEMRMDTLSISNEEIIEKAKNFHCPIYYFVDLMNLSFEALSWFQKLKGKKVLVLTKVDFIPFTISIERIINQIRKIYAIQEEILFLSVKNRKMIQTFLNHMEKHGLSEFLFLGMTNVGKSSLLGVISRICNDTESPVLISEMPNTTLAFSKWDMGHFSIIDAPGFNFQKPFSSEMLLKGVPKKYLKPITMQMKENTILFLEHDFALKQNLEKNSITFFGSSAFSFEKKYTIPVDMKRFEMEVIDKTDLVLPGVGFFYIRRACKVSFFAKEDIKVETRPSLFGGSYDNN